MFYCEKCRKKKGWPGNIGGPRSYGRCEVCGESAGCNDIPCSCLPSDPPPPNPPPKAPEPERWEQCPMAWASKGGTVTFCGKQKGHDGDHRGLRKQWTSEGKLVPITEKAPR